MYTAIIILINSHQLHGYFIDKIKCVQIIWVDGLFWICLNCLYFVVRLSGSTLLNKALAGKTKDLFFKAKASYFQGQGAEFGLKANS